MYCKGPIHIQGNSVTTEELHARKEKGSEEEKETLTASEDFSSRSKDSEKPLSEKHLTKGLFHVWAMEWHLHQMRGCSQRPVHARNGYGVCKSGGQRRAQNAHERKSQSQSSG
jgi:hypothetical protein